MLVLWTYLISVVLPENNAYMLTVKGYGDTSQIRNAIIDKSRDTAHFEIVVSPSSQVITSSVQERYLDRSIRRHGADKTLLVTNKSNVGINLI
jgi:hypothetical protein